MDFPAGGIIDERLYSTRKKGYEEVHISIEDDTGFSMDVIYHPNHTKKQLDGHSERFKNRLGYKDNFDKLIKNDRTIYYNHYEDDIFRTYAGYIINEDDGAVEVIYNIDCQDKQEECKKNEKSDEKRAMNWIESVQFIDDQEED